MYTEFVGIALTFGLAILLAIPFGKFIAQTFSGEKTFADPFFNPFEKIIFSVSGIDPTREMNWKQQLKAMLGLNFLWFGLCYLVLLCQGFLPLNPDGNPSMSPDLAFNTAISFVVNCNLQHYSGESGLSYFGQLLLMFLQFVSAATGIAAAATVFNAMKERTTQTLGNFYNYFVKSCTRVLLPLAVVIAIFLAFNGTPMTFDGKDKITTLQGDSVEVSRGPAAAFVSIKHLGTNGGGFFGANSAHPLENPNYFTNCVELWAQLIIPFSMIFALGFYLKRKKIAYVIFGVMTIGFLLLVIPTVVSEINGNPALSKMGISQTGAMEGKEVRFGAPMTGFWSIATTVISTGSVNGMHDSTMPVSGAMQLLAMMVNAFYGGCGVGFLNFYIFIILAVFISGLMVGRTPEFLGKKIEAREVKIAAFIAILHPLLILSGTALAAHFAASDTEMGYWLDGKASGWLNNPGAHGFSEMLYENTSSAANNGSGFEGLADNNPFWNILTGILLWLGRFIPIIGPVAIAGLLAKKKFIPESSGTLKTDTTIFGIMVFAVIAIIAALSFFPALALGPLAEYFS
ncbi:potassium-transporting ATPase subunit KdpA [Flavobacterium sp. MAH-1]|uniref:Potassium-transporting ATPase potassium-binding subunit n=1 Tax=Flavobacterium agri TaxID=2743471 RepID=A0A7Y9C4R7_9FLAO|nr:potassium-transporting ATPase subunit KdpA [Flavobacterium agri]NUY79594.1 potassium-transporting ATPase subunit KdpA [Flavobacterium agri]NYA69619.1 potassium-transporting ATPase subunit KdpA [Flavobacterium agri]